MPTNELRDYCGRLMDYQIKVNVRLKSCYTPIVGRISDKKADHFMLQTDPNKAPEQISYINVASITNHMRL